MKTAEEVAESVQADIDIATAPLGDEAYLEALDIIVDYCQVCAAAKREELGR